ncbi:hypothetical protein B0H16DRAFT_1526452 [Mycena metata]|uniref:F-box domain-containing protein n=1 Tax=Mycena metata TaxID=1033252 RepID=A0AAD7NKF3_9AGAR|nr:hypothetical protein B0H16DRAFT_1526452 [Mycena metata]
MHRGLQIREIVDLIMFSLDPDLTRDSRALVTLARTAKLFHDPALDVLWKTQDTPANLLRCMPDGVFHVDIIDTPFTALRLLRPIVAKDWERPRVYMNRVKALSFASSRFLSLSGVFPALAICLPGDCIFPKLTKISWGPPEDDFQYINLFLTETIASLSMFSTYSHRQLCLLSTLTRRCPALVDVAVWLRGSLGIAADDVSAVNMAMSSFIRGQQGLHSLKVQVVDMATLDHIAQLPALRSLHLFALPPALLTSPTSGVSTFLHLGSLTFTGVAVELATKFLSMVIESALESLKIGFDPSAPTAAMELFSAALANCRRSHASLTSCDLDIWSSATGTVEHHITGITLFSNLSYFDHLTQLKIATWWGFELNDAAVGALTKVWPRLERLELTEGLYVLGKSPTIECLPLIARNCPMLQTLTLTFDASVAPLPTRALVAQTNLVDLDVAHSPISDSLSVARFISAIFPDLYSVYTTREDHDNEDEEELEAHGEAIAFHRKWKEVETQIPVLAAVREEGQLWSYADSDLGEPDAIQSLTSLIASS